MPYFQRALDEAEKQYGPNDPRVGVEVGNLGEVYRRLGRTKDALPLLRRSVSLAEKQADRDPVGLAAALNNLGLLYRSQGQLAEAEPLYERSLALLTKAVGPDNPNVAQGLNNLAMLYMQEGKPADAVPLLERSRESGRRDARQDASDHQGHRRESGEGPARGGAYRRYCELQAAAAAGDHAAARQDRPATTRGARGGAGGAGRVPHLRRLLRSPRSSIRPLSSTRRRRRPQSRRGGRHPSRRRPGPAGRWPRGYTIHLASMSSMEAAHLAWGRLVKKYPSLAALQQLPPPTIVVPGKGTFYRVLGGEFPTRAAAEAACRPVRKAGGDCVVMAR